MKQKIVKLLKREIKKPNIGVDVCTGLNYKQRPRINCELYAKILEAKQKIIINYS